MKRTTIFLDEILLRRLKQVARAQGKSFAAVVREAVGQYVAARPAGDRQLPSFAGIAASGEADVSSRVDELLWTEPHS